MDIEKRTKICINKKYTFPKKLSKIKYKGKIIIVHPELFLWLVLNDCDELHVFEKLQNGEPIEQVLRLGFDEKKVISVVSQIEAKEFYRCDRGLSLRPRKIQIHLTNKCNLRCRHCYMYSGLAEKNELSTQEWMSVLEDFKNNRGAEVTFTGGEVATLKDFGDIVKFSKKLGLKNKVLTNGILWTEDQIKELSCYIDSVQVSIDGFNAATYKQVRIIDGFDKSLECVRMFSKYGVLCTITTTPIFDLTESWIENYLQFAKKILKEIPKCSVKISNNLMVGRNVQRRELKNDGKISLKMQDIEEFSNLNLEKKFVDENLSGGIRNNCGIGEALTISSIGDVSWCSRIGEAKSLFNVRIDSFKKIYGVSKNIVERTSVDHCVPCKDCDLKYICGGPCRLRSCSEMKDMILDSCPVDKIWEIQCSYRQRSRLIDLMVKYNQFFYK